MITITLKAWQTTLIILALVALVALWGMRDGRQRERLSEARKQSEEALTQYAYTMDSLQREKSADSLRYVAIQRENERLLKDIKSIRKNYDKKRFEIMVLTTDSVLLRFDGFRARLDSLLSGKYIKD